MMVAITTGGTMALAEADDMRRFSIRMPDTEAARAALEKIARLDGPGHAWILPAEIRKLAPGPTPEWEAGLSAMTSYANSKGWTDPAGALRVHIDKD
jgi:hypothetical protein